MHIVQYFLFATLACLNSGCHRSESTNKDIVQSINNEKLLTYFGKAKESIKAREFSSAITFLDSCISISPDSALFHNYKGYCYHYKGFKNDSKNNKIAIINFNRAIELDNSKAKYYHNRGICLNILEFDSDATRDFETAANLDSISVDYEHNKLKMKWFSNRKNALIYADSLINRFPYDGYAYFVRGQLKRDYLHKYIEGNKDIELSRKLGWNIGSKLKL
jgi:tetratricopeptide (TPR) repeat protein